MIEQLSYKELKEKKERKQEEMERAAKYRAMEEFNIVERQIKQENDLKKELLTKQQATANELQRLHHFKTKVKDAISDIDKTIEKLNDLKQLIENKIDEINRKLEVLKKAEEHAYQGLDNGLLKSVDDHVASGKINSATYDVHKVKYNMRILVSDLKNGKIKHENFEEALEKVYENSVHKSVLEQIEKSENPEKQRADLAKLNKILATHNALDVLPANREIIQIQAAMGILETEKGEHERLKKDVIDSVSECEKIKEALGNCLSGTQKAINANQIPKELVNVEKIANELIDQTKKIENFVIVAQQTMNENKKDDDLITGLLSKPRSERRYDDEEDDAPAPTPEPENKPSTLRP